MIISLMDNKDVKLKERRLVAEHSHFKIIFDNRRDILPKVSIILLDWSCRESLHSLDYLANQTIPREQYEVIWVEYYSRIDGGIKERIEKANAAGKEPPIDKWIVMEMPENIYYHKHLMFNVGIAAGEEYR
jgi:hypothetical protein